MMRILTAEQIRALEAAADESGISYLRLMENAGAACAKAIRTRFDDTNKRRVVVLCGKGKNGGDGFVVARKLFENGYNVHVLLVQGPPKADNAREMFGWLRELEQPVEAYSPQNVTMEYIEAYQPDIVVFMHYATVTFNAGCFAFPL